ncbi:BTAD domain-containing putative transcriptional regulator [Micromonospora sp. CPCC 206060]|uniref:BTAD domain-containing putative transcriptional regulator n=1 Tax=Micromonospora sp. CPCC 206060 TaxID=3122406 RepID=UPI002FF27382
MVWYGTPLLARARHSGTDRRETDGADGREVHMTDLHFRILGPPQIVLDGRPVPVGGPKQQALLVLFLLRPNRFVAADWLVDALWDGRPPASAHMTLRTYVAGLRRAVEPQRSSRAPSRILRNHPGGYELRVDPDAIDAVRFGQLVDRAAAALTAGDADAAEQGYDAALALWRGEPLAGPADLGVVRPEVTRLVELRLDAEEGRFAAMVAAGRQATVLAQLRRFVTANPLRERARAQLMLALYRSGRQTEALAVFDEGRRLLADGYGLDPGDEVRAAHWLILTGAVPADTPMTPPVTTDAVVVGATPAGATGRLVGRHAELARLAEALDAAIRHGGRVAAIVGEPGIGKTSLAAALSGQAAATGVPVVWGRCPDIGQAPPFWLWRQVVRELAAMPQAGDAGSAPRLGGFAAGPLAGLTGTVEPDPTARFQAYEAVSELVRAVARPRGLLVVLDDLHAADPDSLLLLRFLSPVLSGTRAFVVVALRPYDHDPTLVATVAALARGSGYTPLRLTGLDMPSVTDLIADHTGMPPTDRVVARLAARTGGNPFFLTELLRWRTDPTGADLPPSIRDTVRLRLHGLPEAARHCLDLLGVAGRDLDVQIMAAALDMTTPAVADALAAAHAAALVTEAGPGGVRFRHPLLAEVVYAELPPPRRAVAHARLAGAYEAAGTVAPAELAYHYGRAVGLGHGDDHLRWSLAAADDATRRLAYEDAIGHLDRAAQRLAVRSAGSPDAARTELAVQLHRASLLQMAVGVGSEAAGQVCARARELLSLVGPDTDIRPALWALGELAANRADFAICTDLAQRLVAAGDDGTNLITAAGEYLLGVVGYFTGRLAEADRRLTTAVDLLREVDLRLLSRQVGRRPVLAAYNFRALVRSLRGDATAAADLTDAAALADELDDLYGRANAALFAGWLGLQEHDVVAVRSAARRCREIGAAGGLPHFVTTGTFLHEWAAARGGDPDRLPAMRAAGQAIYQLGLRATRTIVLSAMAEAYLSAGDAVTAAELADEGLATADELDERVVTAELHRVRGLACGDPAALRTGARLATTQGAGLLLARFTADAGH